MFQKRKDGSVDFFRDWSQYKKGFGNLKNGELWLGLDKIHRLTNSERVKLRVDLEDWNGNTAHAEYDNFAVSNEATKYKLNLGTYSGENITDVMFMVLLLTTTSEKSLWDGLQKQFDLNTFLSIVFYIFL